MGLLFGKPTEADFGYCFVCGEHLHRSELEQQYSIIEAKDVDMCSGCAEVSQLETMNMDEDEMTCESCYDEMNED